MVTEETVAVLRVGDTVEGVGLTIEFDEEDEVVPIMIDEKIESCEGAVPNLAVDSAGWNTRRTPAACINVMGEEDLWLKHSERRHGVGDEVV